MRHETSALSLALAAREQLRYNVSVLRISERLLRRGLFETIDEATIEARAILRILAVANKEVS